MHLIYFYCSKGADRRTLGINKFNTNGDTQQDWSTVTGKKEKKISLIAVKTNQPRRITDAKMRKANLSNEKNLSSVNGWIDASFVLWQGAQLLIDGGHYRDRNPKERN